MDRRGGRARPGGRARARALRRCEASSGRTSRSAWCCSRRTRCSSARASRRFAPGSDIRKRGVAPLRAGLPEAGLVLVGTTAFVCALFWPLVSHMGSTVLGNPGSDSTGGVAFFWELQHEGGYHLLGLTHHTLTGRAVRLGRNQRDQRPVAAAVLPDVSRLAGRRRDRRAEPHDAGGLRPLGRDDVPARALPRLQPARVRLGRARIHRVPVASRSARARVAPAHRGACSPGPRARRGGAGADVAAVRPRRRGESRLLADVRLLRRDGGDHERRLRARRRAHLRSSPRVRLVLGAGCGVRDRAGGRPRHRRCRRRARTPAPVSDRAAGDLSVYGLRPLELVVPPARSWFFGEPPRFVLADPHPRVELRPRSRTTSACSRSHWRWAGSSSRSAAASSLGGARASQPAGLDRRRSWPGFLFAVPSPVARSSVTTVWTPSRLLWEVAPGVSRASRAGTRC